MEALTVTSSILDTTNTSTANLAYTNSSDITPEQPWHQREQRWVDRLDATSLDSVLNSDYSGVTGFFQSANGWGQNFSNMLTNAGTSSRNGRSVACIQLQQQHRIHVEREHLQGRDS